MIEKTKSFVLVLLIVSSLFQSYLLAYSKPNLNPIQETEYIETELLGEQREISQLIFPNQMVLHHGDESHTLLYPNNTFYNIIYDKLKMRMFDGIRAINRTSMNWTEMKNQNRGIEIHFKDGIPMQILQSILQIQSRNVNNTDFIHSIWITTSENGEEVRTFFFSSYSFNVYEVTMVDLTVTDLEQFIAFGNYFPKYINVSNKYYLPTEPLDTVHYHISYHQNTPDELQKSLFIDPSISRKILDREGTEIITDGKRGLKIDRERRWLSYSDPVGLEQIGNDVRENLLSAVKFVNRHGGWNGAYMLSHVPANRNQTFIFRQYIDSFPIIPSDRLNYGYIRMVLQIGVVSSYERSLINLDERTIVKTPAVLPGGEELREMIESYGNHNRITAVYPGYMPTLTDESIELQPKWVIELMDGTFDFLD